MNEWTNIEWKLYNLIGIWRDVRTSERGSRRGGHGKVKINNQTKSWWMKFLANRINIFCHRFDDDNSDFLSSIFYDSFEPHFDWKYVENTLKYAWLKLKELSIHRTYEYLWINSTSHALNILFSCDSFMLITLHKNWFGFSSITIFFVWTWRISLPPLQYMKVNSFEHIFHHFFRVCKMVKSLELLKHLVKVELRELKATRSNAIVVSISHKTSCKIGSTCNVCLSH